MLGNGIVHGMHNPATVWSSDTSLRFDGVNDHAKFPLAKATADTKLMSLAINGISAVLFTINGLVLWEIAVPMAVGQIIGARLGSNLVMSRGTSFVQPIITVVTLVVALKLLFFP